MGSFISWPLPNIYTVNVSDIIQDTVIQLWDRGLVIEVCTFYWRVRNKLRVRNQGKMSDSDQCYRVNRIPGRLRRSFQDMTFKSVIWMKERIGHSKGNAQVKVLRPAKALCVCITEWGSSAESVRQLKNRTRWCCIAGRWPRWRQGFYFKNKRVNSIFLIQHRKTNDVCVV